ncbi:G-protein-coupled receptor family protein, partial [Reticulomyxa filosa]
TTTTTTTTTQQTDLDETDALKAPFTDYCPHAFRYLRTSVYKISDRDYLQSIQQGAEEKNLMDVVAKFSEGRSGALFFYTLDAKYMIKTVTKQEGQLLLNLLKPLVQHMKNHPHSYLNKFLGFHSLKMYNLEIYFVVLANVFVPNLEPHEKYDLKGSWIDRHTNHHVELGKLMKDEDLKKALLLDPGQSSEMFQRLVHDTQFLMEQQVMDYSLLLGIYYVGVDPKKIDTQKRHQRDPKPLVANDVTEERKEHLLENNNDSDANADQELFFPDLLRTNRNMPEDVGIKRFVRPRAPTYASMKEVAEQKGAVRARVIEGPGIYFVGIIDMLQKWNTEKKVESLFKAYCRCKDKNGISAVDPKFYRKRFLRKMFMIGIRPKSEEYSGYGDPQFE